MYHRLVATALTALIAGCSGSAATTSGSTVAPATVGASVSSQPLVTEAPSQLTVATPTASAELIVVKVNYTGVAAATVLQDGFARPARRQNYGIEVAVANFDPNRWAVVPVSFVVEVKDYFAPTVGSEGVALPADDYFTNGSDPILVAPQRTSFFYVFILESGSQNTTDSTKGRYRLAPSVGTVTWYTGPDPAAVTNHWVSDFYQPGDQGFGTVRLRDADPGLPVRMSIGLGVAPGLSEAELAPNWYRWAIIGRCVSIDPEKSIVLKLTPEQKAAAGEAADGFNYYNLARRCPEQDWLTPPS